MMQQEKVAGESVKESIWQRARWLLRVVPAMLTEWFNNSFKVLMD